MPTTLRRMDEKAARELYLLCTSSYLEGECYEFSLALHHGLGWPMFGLMKDEEIRHTVVQNPKDKTWYDARGLVSEERLGEPFALPSPNIVPVTEEDLRKQRPLYERDIQKAAEMAEVLWPDLPWKNSFRERVRQFTEELEELSRRHGLWLRAILPAQPPLITSNDGEETGYVIQPSNTGTTYAIDRCYE